MGAGWEVAGPLRGSATFSKDKKQPLEGPERRKMVFQVSKSPSREPEWELTD